MSIECYYGNCPHHESQYNEDSGPFCGEYDCIATPQELQQFAEQRVIYLRSVQQLYSNSNS
jgi:hypothetical protein